MDGRPSGHLTKFGLSRVRPSLTASTHRFPPAARSRRLRPRRPDSAPFTHQECFDKSRTCPPLLFRRLERR
ncbi:hypothetical protein ACFQYP_38945 [Nonomuraea antimicrobica]